MNKIIITGNPVDGYTHWGPFDHLTDTIADQFEGDWWVADLATLDTGTHVGTAESDDIVKRLRDAYMSLLDIGGATERETCREGADELERTRTERDTERDMANDLALALVAVGCVHPLAPEIQAVIDRWEQIRLDKMTENAGRTTDNVSVNDAVQEVNETETDRDDLDQFVADMNETDPAFRQAYENAQLRAENRRLRATLGAQLRAENRRLRGAAGASSAPSEQTSAVGTEVGDLMERLKDAAWYWPEVDDTAEHHHLVSDAFACIEKQQTKIEQLCAAGDGLDEALGWDTSFGYDAATTRTAISQRRNTWKEARNG